MTFMLQKAINETAVVVSNSLVDSRIEVWEQINGRSTITETFYVPVSIHKKLSEFKEIPDLLSFARKHEIPKPDIY